MPAKKNRIINLLPKEDFEKTTLGRTMKWALSSFRFMVIFVELVVISGFLYRFWLDVQISDLNDEVQQKSAVISSRSSFENEFRSLQNRLYLFRTITDPNNNSSVFFEEISSVIPREIQVSAFSRTDDLIELRGTTADELPLANFLAHLNRNDRFGSVELQTVKYLPETSLVEFSINLTITRNNGGV